jgi:hypothetical protein
MKHTLKSLITAALLISALGLVSARDVDLRMIPAIWHHGLNSSRLVDYKEGEHLVISDIWTGSLGSDAVVRHSLEVKVSAWDKPFSKSVESEDKQRKETLTVTLHRTNNPREMKAEFEHTVYEAKRVVLKFSGITLLVRES